MIEIDGFYDYTGLTDALERLDESSVIDISSIGTSREGRELWCATACAPDRPRSPENYPATLVTANMHATEFAGSWTALHLLDHLAEGYGDESGITDLLERQTIYVIPRVAPDGAEFVLETRTRTCRSRFVDLEPEDVRESNTVIPGDLTGDGRILSMRWPAEDGDHVVPDDDPRLTLPRGDEETEGTFYRHTVEGEVANYDGGSVSEASMRSDFNRNFPADDWRPYDWTGHGQYPLSEPETRALAEFVLEHPNIAGVADLHTGNPAIFYPEPLKGTGSDFSHPRDAKLIRRIGETAEEMTGFPFLKGYWEASEGTPVALGGSFKDWLYEHTGVPAYIVEHGMLYNSLGLETADLAMDDREHARATDEALLGYHDDHPENDVFYEWERVDHPQLGEVEVGGWDWVRYGSPALEEMPSIADTVTDWLLEFAEWAPDVDVEATAEALDGELSRVTATVRNRGRLPTNLTECGRESIHDAKPLVTLEGGDVVSGRQRQLLDHLDARGGSERHEWVVRGGDAVEVVVESPRGVASEARVELDE